MMQRNSSGSQRIIIIVAVVAVLFVSVLYFMKRVEANRLSGNLDTLQIERKEKEDQLNGVLTDYQSKIEEMTRQLSDYSARTSKCEDQKATIQVSMEKLELERADCLNSHEATDKENEQLQSHISSLTDLHRQVNTQLEAGKNDVRNIQQALNTAEQELEQCQDSQEKCNARAQTTSLQLTQCQQQQAACQQQVVALRQQQPSPGQIRFSSFQNGNGNPQQQPQQQPPQQQPNLPNPGPVPAAGNFQGFPQSNQNSFNVAKPQDEVKNPEEKQPPPGDGEAPEVGDKGDTAEKDADKEEKELLHELGGGEEGKGQNVKELLQVLQGDGEDKGPGVGEEKEGDIPEHYDDEDGDRPNANEDDINPGDGDEDGLHL